MIQVKNVTKYFDDFKVLDDFSLNVRKGTIYGLVGPNGAGKTTIINHINGVLKPLEGEITINGTPVYENVNVKQRVLSIADDWFYYSTYTIKQMAHFYADIYPHFNFKRYEAIKEIFKIDEKRQIRKLSKGMKKQVAFWLVLSAMPQVLILDEPLDGLDPVMRKQVLNLVIADVADREMTVLVSSHNLRELEDICDWVGIIHQGRMIIEKPDEEKSGVHKENGKLYYYVDGVKQAGLGMIEYEGGLYYVRSGGELATGSYFVHDGNGFVTNFKTYEFGADGKFIG